MKDISVRFFTLALASFLLISGCGSSNTTAAGTENSSTVSQQYSVQEEAGTASTDTKEIGEEKVENEGLKHADISTGAPAEFRIFNVYTDAKSPDNHFVPSGWMGDYGDIKMNDKFMDKPRSGSTAIQIVYTNKATQGARWAGIYWQNPPNNWGTRPGGYDLTGAKKVTFWARGEKGGERVEEFKIGGITGEYADSDVAGIGPVVLTKEWQQYAIDLDGKDLSSISGGFCWATNLDVNPDGVTFYLDDIRYE